MKIPIKSSQIEAVEFDQGNQNLVIEFKNGSQYSYSGCTPEVYKALLDSPSKGEYFARNIKNVLPFKKI